MLSKPQGAYSFEKIAGLASDTNRQLDRLTRLIEDLLDVSRIQTGKMTFRFETLNVSELVQDVVNRILPELKAVACKISLELADGLNVQWDRVRVEQIVWNYLANATRYAPGSDVLIRTIRSGENVKIEVCDTGPGIEKKNQALIFERYERGAARSGVSGLGLGLFIVRNIAEGHGGKAWVESEPGHGSKFVVELPRDPLGLSQPESKAGA